MTLANVAMADNQTDRLMTKVVRDTNTYITADVRGETEDEAYEQALALLSEKIAAYFKENGKGLPDAVILSNISNQSERLISQSGSNRCRVLVYVKKKDLIPIGEDGSSAMLAKNDNESYSIVQTSASQKQEKAPVVISPALSRIASAKTLQEVQTLLVELKKSKDITGAAAFPIASVNDFFVVVIDRSQTSVAILHCDAGKWTNATTGEKVNLDSYKYCTAYWLTLP